MLYAMVAMGLGWSAEPAWKDLYSPSAESSSFLKSNWNKYTENYHPAYALDDNPSTAWVEGADGDGLGESITIPLSPLKSARALRLQVRNGYQKSQMLFNANAVPKEVTVSVLSNGTAVAVKAVALEKKMGWQEVIVTIPPGRGLDAVRVQLVSVYPGKSYKDSCISDIKVAVDTDVAYNAAYEETKHTLLKNWVKDRIATAQYFASQPKEYPFAFTTFDYEEATAPDVAALDAQLGTFRAAMAALKADTKWYRAEYPGKPLVWPDGLWELQRMDRVLQPTAVSFTETPDAKGRKLADASEEGFGSSTEWSNYKVRYANGQGSPVQAAFFSYRAVEEGRGTYVTENEVLVQYDEKQRPTFFYVSGRHNDAEMGDELLPGEALYKVEYSAEGKISSIRVQERTLTWMWPESGEGQPAKVLQGRAHALIGH